MEIIKKWYNWKLSWYGGWSCTFLQSKGCNMSLNLHS